MATYTSDLIPAMTNFTSPSGEASSSSYLASGFESFRAMDNENGSTYCWHSGSEASAKWIKYQFTSSKRIQKYTMTGRNDGAVQTPKAWSLQGSTDNSSWTTLHSVSGTSFTQNETKTYTFTNDNWYTYYRIYITDSNDPNYVALGQMELMEANVEAATVTTTTPSSITVNSASSGGNVTFDGYGSITARGVCWNTSGTPTTSDSKTTDGTGTGSYTSSITGLSPGTTYHVRAYATNSYGTSYGAESDFTTLDTTVNYLVYYRRTRFPGSITGV